MAAAFVLPILYGTHHASMANPDDYDLVASNLAVKGMLSEDGITPSAIREPGYPTMLGIFYKVLGHNSAAFYVLNGLLASGAVLGLFFVGAELFGESVGLLAAVIAAFYPPFIYYASQPRREIGLVFMSVLSVLWLVRAAKGGLKTSAAAGLVNAGLALSSTTYFPFGIGTAPVLLLWLGRKKPAQALKLTLVYALFFVMLYSLWPLRNYRVYHQLIIGTSAGAGAVFYTNQVVPSEVGGTEEEHQILANDPVMTEAGGMMDLVAREKFFWKKGVERIKEDPARYARLVAKRFFVDAWRVIPRPRNYDTSYRLLWWVGLLSDGWIVPLGLIGLFFWRLRPADAVFVPAFVASVNLVYAMIFFILRYRIPVMPWLILLAALTLVRAKNLLHPTGE